ncbi:MAG: hypothetical protein JO190_01160 [Candidatus Eremiobacteraeota bacterium]|nr:hypothetical protein [Candidatus Eremiobacteraeota bacterium]MBV8720971.1 hypothetical protein [Candidatus Eremiobacteraeota bacterium]
MRVLSALACAVILAGCGLTSSPAEGLTFAPPAGWQSSPGIMGFMQFWRSPTNSEEVLMLFRSPKQLNSSDVFDSAKLKDTQVVEQTQIKICGNQPATYYKGEAESSVNNGASKPHNVEMTMTNASGATYFALYVYPLKAEPNGEAETALHQLCVKKS